MGCADPTRTRSLPRPRTGLDLVPGDKQVVTATGLNGRPVTVRYYGKDE
jgi:hypothetical protein